ncbi:PepSY-associated TM helix domain-containing protein [Antrihabitans cavernicola]|uniref:PepSY domain-containing protein n=1 Tax=Antrihabitans cavernicola TaxID=2495913 RepID=A0A5A7SAA8_9NOCA|nr:PepSY-associated TM helix domain-containing protein [Spelaeibacter cavernicola]KAA0022229.1 PepSY domain-containing protein [Spelaeibacter cavernicola]
MTAELSEAPSKRPPTRRRVRKRPLRRAWDYTHRWSALILGMFLVVETTSGAILLYNAELFRATHSTFYQHTASTTPMDAEQAMQVVQRAHPDFPAGWVSPDGGILAVGSADYSSAYAVDPGTGHINGFADLNGGVLGFLVNMHDCAFTCAGSPGTVGTLSHPVPTLGTTWLNGITWGALILGTLGLFMVLLGISGIILWWPTFARFSHGFRLRLKKGRYARDLDLHNVIGIVSIPFLLMWGITGAAFELPVVEKAWLAMTGGNSTVDESRFTFTPREGAADRPTLSVTEAADVALSHAAGRVSYLTVPTPDADYYSVAVAGDYAPYGGRAFYSGDVMVYINPHDRDDVKVTDASHDQPLANTFYDKVFEPAHFGWLVSGWWRSIWFGFGMTPLILMVTGVSTWLFKRGVAKRRRAATR